MSRQLNVYGDRLVSTSGTHGADIAAQRMDDLDREALAMVLGSSDSRPVTCDIGCGSGIQGFRFALLGAISHLYDLHDLSGQIGSFKKLFPEASIAFHQGNALETLEASGVRNISAAYSQRTLHYMNYHDALYVFKILRKRLSGTGKIFISASGLHSELGEGYQAARDPLETRSGKLSPAMAAKHEIKEDVCLYTEDDMRKLAQKANFQKMNIWQSKFGNIKAIIW